MSAGPLVGPAQCTPGHLATTHGLNEVTADFTAIDAAERIKAMNDAIYRRAIDQWFRRTDAAVEAVRDAEKAVRS